MPHKGCPHDCVFCNQKNITGQDHVSSIQEARTTIDAFLNSIGKHEEKSYIEVAFFGGSFTGIPKAQQVEYLELTKTYIDAGLIDGIRLSTRPDYIDKNILEFLKTYHVKTIELGVQSLDEDVLLSSNRGHSVEVVDRSCQLIKRFGFKLGLQMMIGLPKDSLEKSLKTAEHIIRLKPDMVRIYPTIVIEGTDLALHYQNKTYHPLSMDEAVDWTAKIYKLFMRESIPVIRMGLQSSEALDQALAGPYHPSFRQLVESQLYFDALVRVLKENKKTSLYVHPKAISDVVGQKRSNLRRLEQIFHIKKIKVYPKELPLDIIEVEIEKEVFKVLKMTTI